MGYASTGDLGKRRRESIEERAPACGHGRRIALILLVERV
jgi:predicted secreted Zn-dependent protease